MDHNYLCLTDVVTVSRESDGTEPLNLVYRSRLDSTGQRVLRGPGLYVISFGAEVIYIGKYQPLNGTKIFDDRWLRHLETVTLRGARVGFGGEKNPNKKLQRLLEEVANPSLKASLTELYETQRENRFKDTGVVTSQNRVRFADEHWDMFRTRHDNQILTNFEFMLLRIDDCKSQAEASGVVTQIEKSVLNVIKPRCNHQFSMEHHNHLRRQNKIPEVVNIISQCARKEANRTIASCVVLGRATP